MQVLIIGDLHWGARSDNVAFLEHYAAYFRDQFFKILRVLKPDAVVQVGDVFDKRSYLNVNTLYYARKYFIDPLRESGIPSYVLTGNHDTYFKNTSRVNSLQEVYGCCHSQSPSFQVIWEPLETEFGLLVPWIAPDEQENSLLAIEHSKARYCFGHFDIPGFYMSGGKKSEHGFQRSMFAKFTRVISGHYHGRQNDGNIFYCGVPYEKSWEDHGQWIGIHLLDTDTGAIKAIPNPVRMHYQLDFTDGALSEASDIDPSNLEKKIVRLVVHDTKHAVKLERLIQKISAAKPESLSVVHKALTINSEQVLEEIKVADPDDTVTTITNYIDRLDGVPATERTQVKDLLLTLHSQAIQSQTGDDA